MITVKFTKNSYEIKDDLKREGFVWNKEEKYWEKSYENRIEFEKWYNKMNDVTYNGRKGARIFANAVCEVEEIEEEIEEEMDIESEEELTAEDIINSLVQFGSEPYIVETIEQAEEVLEEINKGIEEVDLTNEEERETQLSWLDLSGVNNVKHIYRIGEYGGQRGTICFSKDWDME